MSTPTSCDLLLEGGQIVDGSGALGYPGNVAITRDRIVGILAPDQKIQAERTIDCAGRVLAPGFIDVHTHDDRAILDDPTMPAKLSQGVTTVITGNCGISLAPLTLPRPTQAPPPPLTLLGGASDFCFPTLASYAKAVNAAGPTINVAALIGHSTLRVGAMPDPLVKANREQRAQMASLLQSAMSEGALGLSTGLFYAINAPADVDEVSELAAIAARFGGVYATHLRDEFAGVLAAIDEACESAQRAKIPLIISHHKCAGPANWGRSHETLAAIERAARNQEIALDAYPYRAGSTVLLPDLVDGIIDIIISDCPAKPELRGRMLADIAEEWGVTQRSAAERIVPASAIYFQMREDDVRRILSHTKTMIGSDGLPRDAHPHPRLWGTFPRVLGHYARDEALFSLETAVHKMTGLSAQRFGLHQRGAIALGKIADLTIFDPDTIADTASFENPTCRARGIEWVIVAGQPSLDPHGDVQARSGGFLSRASA